MKPWTEWENLPDGSQYVFINCWRCYRRTLVLKTKLKGKEKVSCPNCGNDTFIKVKRGGLICTSTKRTND